MNSGDSVVILFSFDTNVILDPVLEFNIGEQTLRSYMCI